MFRFLRQVIPSCRSPRWGVLRSFRNALPGSRNAPLALTFRFRFGLIDLQPSELPSLQGDLAFQIFTHPHNCDGASSLAAQPIDLRPCKSQPANQLRLLSLRLAGKTRSGPPTRRCAIRISLVWPSPFSTRHWSPAALSCSLNEEMRSNRQWGIGLSERKRGELISQSCTGPRLTGMPLTTRQSWAIMATFIEKKNIVIATVCFIMTLCVPEVYRWDRSESFIENRFFC